MSLTGEDLILVVITVAKVRNTQRRWGAEVPEKGQYLILQKPLARALVIAESCFYIGRYLALDIIPTRAI